MRHPRRKMPPRLTPKGGYTEHTATTRSTRRLLLRAAYYPDRLVQAAFTRQQHGSTAKIRPVCSDHRPNHRPHKMVNVLRDSTPTTQIHVCAHTQNKLRRLIYTRRQQDEREHWTQHKQTNTCRSHHPRVIEIRWAAHRRCGFFSSLTSSSFTFSISGATIAVGNIRC